MSRVNTNKPKLRIKCRIRFLYHEGRFGHGKAAFEGHAHAETPGCLANTRPGQSTTNRMPFQSTAVADPDPSAFKKREGGNPPVAPLNRNSSVATE